MADALSVPLVNIAGPADIGEQRPMGQRAINLQEPFACVPCSHIYKAPYVCREGSRACVTSLSVLRVYEAAESLLTVEHAAEKNTELSRKHSR
jgi:ADP-heptose:LPS heptosyltransferase